LCSSANALLHSLVALRVGLNLSGVI